MLIILSVIVFNKFIGDPALTVFRPNLTTDLLVKGAREVIAKSSIKVNISGKVVDT